ncbi:hypothetical protein AXF42_Ash000678 [Apostasia shenzhenica]|uniref:Uncharacterized protein n=1 Tax=Apostasia shenzhenica TaxID=1088818 RepID=A0A2I0AH07_9ASPA|nr:hypothetical protein AXF42_Ash000678 [Apostasia shenzhenica]
MPFDAQNRRIHRSRNRAGLHLPLHDLPLSMELEDDVLFADLSRQIALLIMEDEEISASSAGAGAGAGAGVVQEFPICYYPAPVQGCYYEFTQAMMMMPPSNTCYKLGCTRESRGTGVFIPKSSLPRGRSKQFKGSPRERERGREGNCLEDVHSRSSVARDRERKG